MSVRSERLRAAAMLRRHEVPRAEIRAILAADDPETVRRYLELHRERLQEQLVDRHRALAVLERSLTEHLQTRSIGRATRAEPRPRRERAEAGN